jgi:hypothetical protein
MVEALGIVVEDYVYLYVNVLRVVGIGLVQSGGQSGFEVRNRI